MIRIYYSIQKIWLSTLAVRGFMSLTSTEKDGYLTRKSQVSNTKTFIMMWEVAKAIRNLMKRHILMKIMRMRDNFQSIYSKSWRPSSKILKYNSTILKNWKKWWKTRCKMNSMISMRESILITANYNCHKPTKAIAIIWIRKSYIKMRN